MESEIGRYLEGRLLVAVNLIKTVYDYSLGQGPDTHCFIEGRELVFSKGDPTPPGFVRVLPYESWISLSFPMGAQISDPLKRLKGPRGSRLRVTIRDSTELDYYMRRIIDAAYSIG